MVERKWNNNLLEWMNSKNAFRVTIFIISFLIARATFFTVAAPAGLPFLVFIALRFPHFLTVAIVGIFFGTLTFSLGQTAIISIQMILFLLYVYWKKDQLYSYFFPIYVIYLAVQSIWQLLYYQSFPPSHIISSIGIEFTLVVLCTIIMTKLLEWIPKKTYNTMQDLIGVVKQWPHLKEKQMEIYSFVFLFLGILLLGFQDFQLGLFHFAIAAVHFSICMVARFFPFTHSVLFGTIVGIVQAISTLSFSAMISMTVVTAIVASFAKMYKNLGIALFSVIPSIGFFLYDTTLPLDSVYFTSILIASFLFFMMVFSIPDQKLDEAVLESVIPVRPQVEQVMSVIQMVHSMIQNIMESPRINPKENVIPSICHSCLRFNYCYRKNDMSQIIQKWYYATKLNKQVEQLNYEQLIEKKCIKPKKLIDQLSYNWMKDRLSNHYSHGKAMVSSQILDFLHFLEQTIHQSTNESSQNLMDNEADESTRRFQMNYTIYNKPKIAGSFSGDTISVCQINERYTLALLSDGMGHSADASETSYQIVKFMQKYMQHFISPETAMHTLHYLFSLHSKGDMYATLDVSLFDLHNGTYFSWKAGSMSTYVVRHMEVFKINSFAPPVGAMPHFYVEMNAHDLKSEDVIFIVSDGIFSMNEEIHVQEQFFMKTILQLVQKKIPIQSLLYELMDSYNDKYELTDDCTVVAITLQHANTSWHTVNNYVMS